MKRIALAIFLSSLALAVAFFVTIFLLLQNKDFQKRIIAQVQTQFRNQVTLKSFKTSFMPPISLVASDVNIKMKSQDREFFLDSPEVKLRLKLLPLLFRKIELSHVRALNSKGYFSWKEKEAQTTFKKIALSDLDIELGNVSLEQSVSFSLRGIFFGSSGNISSQGTLFLNAKDGAPKLDSLKANVYLKEADFSKFVPLISSKPPLQVNQGTFSWDGDLNWQSSKLLLAGSGSFRQLVYALSSTPTKVSSPADFDFKLKGEWDVVGAKFQLSELILHSPYGDFFVEGSFGSDFETPPLDLKVKSDSVNLDRIPEFLVPLDKAIPNKFGFSGKMQMDLFVKGKTSTLSISGSSDFTSSLLSYSAYFTKPKELPLKFQYDFMLKNGKVLQGDINLWLKEMSLKGTVTDFDINTGQGEVTFLTNKFSLDGWETIFEPIKKYPMKGWAKLLLSAKGSFASPEDLRYSGALTLEDAQAVYQELPVRNLNATLEFTNQRASSGKLDFVAASSPIHVEYIRNIPPHESLSLKFTSPEWYPSDMIEPLKAVVFEWKGSNAKKTVEKVESILSRVLSEKEPLRNVSLSVSWIGTLVSVQEVFFYLYGGLVRGAGEMEFGLPEPHYNFGVQVEKLDLKPLISHLTNRSIMQGDFYLLGNFQGDNFQGRDVLDRLRGQGEFKIVGGAFNNFDLLGSIGKSAQYIGLASFSNGVTPFNDLQSNFVIENSKVITDELTLVSSNFTATAHGFFSLGGVLNYQVNINLGSGLASKIGRSEFESSDKSSQQNSVAIPLQLYGDFSNPKIGLDSSTLGQAVEQFIGDKLMKKKQKESGEKKESVLPSDPREKPSIQEGGLSLLDELFGKKAKDPRTPQTPVSKPD